jgi:hypothetical protein
MHSVSPPVCYLIIILSLRGSNCRTFGGVNEINLRNKELNKTDQGAYERAGKHIQNVPDFSICMYRPTITKLYGLGSLLKRR